VYGACDAVRLREDCARYPEKRPQHESGIAAARRVGAVSRGLRESERS
jgi:hypothetical protein